MGIQMGKAVKNCQKMVKTMNFYEQIAFLEKRSESAICSLMSLFVKERFALLIFL